MIQRREPPRVISDGPIALANLVAMTTSLRRAPPSASPRNSSDTPGLPTGYESAVSNRRNSQIDRGADQFHRGFAIDPAAQIVATQSHGRHFQARIAQDYSVSRPSLPFRLSLAASCTGADGSERPKRVLFMREKGMTDGRVALKVTVMEGDFRDQELRPRTSGGASSRPRLRLCPSCFAPPHSGAFYPPELLSASRLDPMTLRRSEDAFVDELFAAAPSLGAPLLRARFARAYLDPNREPYELDPAMFADALPASRQQELAAREDGARHDRAGRRPRRGNLCPQTSAPPTRCRWIDRLYRPYHRAFAAAVTETREKFGYYLLVVDFRHSMPSACLGERGRAGARRHRAGRLPRHRLQSGDHGHGRTGRCRRRD